MLRQHEIEIRVRYCETDAMGLLHHANYFNLFEVGRTELFRAQGGDYRALEAQGIYFVVAKLTCTYRAPARYDDVLRLRTTLANISPAKLEHDYELFRGEECLAVAHSVLACVNRVGRPIRIPDVIPGFTSHERHA